MSPNKCAYNDQASVDGHVDLLWFLVEHGTDATVKDDNGSTPLHQVSFRSYVELARFLVEHGADVAVRDNDRSTPLHRASARSHVERARFLLVKHGADVSAKGKYG